jgi:hypothetical protein
MIIRIAIARLRAIFRRDGTAAEIDQGLLFHLDMRADEYACHGLDPQAARRRRCAGSAMLR